MTGDYCDALWPDEQEVLPLRVVAEVSGLSESELMQLIDCGALVSFAEASGQRPKAECVHLTPANRSQGHASRLEPPPLRG